MGRPQEVRFNHVNNLAELKQMSPAELVGVITFVKENHTVYLGTDQYCNVAPDVIVQSDVFNTVVNNRLNDRLKGTFVLRGNLSTKSDLDVKDINSEDPPNKGDVWYIDNTKEHYVWNGSKWVKLSSSLGQLFWGGDGFGGLSGEDGPSGPSDPSENGCCNLTNIDLGIF